MWIHFWLWMLLEKSIIMNFPIFNVKILKHLFSNYNQNTKIYTINQNHMLKSITPSKTALYSNISCHYAIEYR